MKIITNKKTGLATIMAIGLMACANGEQKGATSDTVAAVLKNSIKASNIDNTLTDDEKGDGLVLLFDGKSTDGWRAYQNKPSESWLVADGMLHCLGDSTNKTDRRADLVTTAQFENFDFSIDWKIAPQGNSGILYLVTEDYPAAYESGPEYQLIDDVGFPQPLEDWQKTAANYAMNPAPTARPNPAGTWNTTRIVKMNNNIEHWLNGEKVVEYELGNNEWKTKKGQGKWKDTPGYGLAKKGHIALQDHGSGAWFKNIKLSEL